MYYTIYKTINLINNKIYIGKHQTKNINDNYFGSGKLLIRAIEKYGIDNFKKEILHIFDSEEEMNQKESELVTEEFVIRNNNYNLCPGGKGGFGFINRRKLGIPNITKKNAKEYSKKANKRLNEIRSDDPQWQKNINEKISKSIKNSIQENGHWWNEKRHKISTIEKMKCSHKGKHVGSKNSQYGTMWITNGLENKKIKKINELEEGWRKGRKNVQVPNKPY